MIIAEIQYRLTAIIVNCKLVCRTNTATSCRKCNVRKGSTLPTDLKRIGMMLAREPRVPSKWELASNAKKMSPKNVHPTWRPFLGMNMLLEDDNGKDSDDSSGRSSSLEL
jgi:hypothetical protein